MKMKLLLLYSTPMKINELIMSSSLCFKSFNSFELQLYYDQSTIVSRLPLQPFLHVTK